MNKNFINEHLKKIEGLKQTSTQIYNTVKQEKQNYLNNIHTLYTQGVSATTPLSTLSNKISLETKKYEANTAKKSLSNIPVDRQIMQLETEFIEAGQFDSKSLTKFLAAALTNRTNQEWIPIRYLLKEGTLRNPPIEAYAVITVDSLLNFEEMGNTITLLNFHKYYISPNRYGIKYTENEYKDATPYKNVNNETMQYIWQMSSYNFISISDTNTFNAFFNLNQTQNKPFLHLPLNPIELNILKSFDEKLPTYSNYSKPQISPTHPRAIANNILAELVNNRLERNYLHLNEQQIQL